MTVPPRARSRIAVYLLVADGARRALPRRAASARPGAGAGADRARRAGSLVAGVAAAAASSGCPGSASRSLALGAAAPGRGRSSRRRPAMLDVFTHLLVFLLLVKLYTRRTPRDARDVAFLSFFMLVAASPVTTSVVFLALFVTFLVVGTWLLMLRHVANEADDATPDGAAGAAGAGLERDLLRPVAGRLGGHRRRHRAAVPRHPARRPGRAAVAGGRRRAWCPASRSACSWAPSARSRPTPRWSCACTSPSFRAARARRSSCRRCAGAASPSTTSTAATWTVGRSTLKLTLRRELPVPFPVHQYYGGPVLTQEIYLEPLGTDMIFGAPARAAAAGPLGLRHRRRPRQHRGAGRRRPGCTTRWSRSRRSATRARPTSPTRGCRTTRAGRRATRSCRRCPPRVAALAREVTARQRGPLGGGPAAHAPGWAASSPTRSCWSRTTALDPLEEFLFVRRAGNCEYFAAALAVMLRTLGIPARVVNGFQRGEWNPYGRYYMVRLRDAHSWVEVFVDGAGLGHARSLAPAGVEVAPVAASTTLWLDSLRMSWYRYVVSFSLHDQLAAAETRAAGRVVVERGADGPAELARDPAPGAGRGRAARPGRRRARVASRSAAPGGAGGRHAGLLRAGAPHAGAPGAGAGGGGDRARVRAACGGRLGAAAGAASPTPTSVYASGARR